MRVLILPRYEPKGASSRYRFYQYISHLKTQRWFIEVKPLLSNNYIKYLYEDYQLPLFEIILSYIKRMILLIRKRKFDIIWIQQEAFPWIPFWFEKFFLNGKAKIVTDYDDAFFHRYDLHNLKVIRLFLGKKIDNVMKISDLVLAGNNYIAERAAKSGANKIVVFPSVVDTYKFKPGFNSANKRFTIGWIGTPGTSKYLLEISNALKNVANGDVEIVLVGAGNIRIDGITFSVRRWEESIEVEEINNFDVGIMPLPDTPWERGKCGLKLIQYMSCGKPVVGSPVGVNKEIIIDGFNGFKAKSNEEWLKYLNLLKSDKNLRLELGKNGRKFVEENFSLINNEEKLIKYFSDLISEKD